METVAKPDFDFLQSAAVPQHRYVGAVRALVPLLSKMGPALKLASSEITKNVDKIAATGCESLEGLLECELANGTYGSEPSGSVGLLWTHRAMQLVEAILGNLGNGADLPAAAAQGYADTLRVYHGWAVRGLFKVGLKAVPSTPTFLSRLGTDPEATSVDLMDILRGLRATNARVGELLNNAERRAKSAEK